MKKMSTRHPLLSQWPPNLDLSNLAKSFPRLAPLLAEFDAVKLAQRIPQINDARKVLPYVEKVVFKVDKTQPREPHKALFVALSSSFLLSFLPLRF